VRWVAIRRQRTVERTSTHLSLDKDCPDFHPIMPLKIGKVVAISRSVVCRLWFRSPPVSLARFTIAIRAAPQIPLQTEFLVATPAAA
jgi:hypothetical protein